MKKEKELRAVGLDYSSREFFVTSDGEKGNYPNFRYKADDKIKLLYDRLDKASGARERCAVMGEIRGVYREIDRKRTAWQKRTARRLLKRYDVVCVESLDFEEMMYKNPGLTKKTKDNDFDGFVGILKKICQRKKNKRLVEIDRWYPSTRTCHYCGYVTRRDMDLGLRQWRCECCECLIERDLNAAINIRGEGLKEAGLVTWEWDSE